MLSWWFLEHINKVKKWQVGALPSVPTSNLIKVTHIQQAGNFMSWMNISWIFVERMDKIVVLRRLLSENADMYKNSLKCWKRIIKPSANFLIPHKK